MICVTGAETTVEALARRLDAEPELLHEVRLDHLREPLDDTLWRLVAKHARRVLLCLRAERQGGAFRGDEQERAALLKRGAEAGARYVDLESDVDDALLDAVGRSRAVLSWHDFRGDGDLQAQVRAMVARDPAVVKVAATVEDAADLVRLLTLRPAIPQRAVLIGMGAAGLLSRTHYARFGSAWTYVAADETLATAPGQLDLRSARRYGLPESASAPLCALVGGPQVMGSPGPWVYGGLYRQLGLDWSYVPVVTRSLRGVLPLLEALDARGLSVTMPLKLEAFERCRPDPAAAALGAVNSLRRDGEGWRGRNSDVAGVREPLRAAGAKGPVLVLGAGGAARAAVAACEALGLEVTVAARRPERAPMPAMAWAERAEVPHEVLINATPVVGDESPWPSEGPFAPIVFELALGAHSRLLREAEAAGSRTLDARRMWLHQGAEQMGWFLDRAITPAQLESLLP